MKSFDDPHLFKPLFAGSSWTPWRAFLKSLFALPMTDADLDLYRHHTARQAPPAKPFTEASIVVRPPWRKEQDAQSCSQSTWQPSVTTLHALPRARR